MVYLFNDNLLRHYNKHANGKIGDLETLQSYPVLKSNLCIQSVNNNIKKYVQKNNIYV